MLTRARIRGSRATLIWVTCGVLILVLTGSRIVRVRQRSDIVVPRASVHIATVVRGPFVRDIVAEGTVVAANNPTLFAPAGGTVTFMVTAGEAVTSGQILVFIENPGLKNQLARERASLDGLVGALERQSIENHRQLLESQRVVELAKTQLHAAERELERMKNGLEQGVVAHRELDKAQDARVTYEQAVANAKLQNSSLAVELKTRQTEIDRQKLLVADLLRRVQALTLRSPANGFVGNLLVNQKAVVREDTGLLTVVDLSVLQVEFSVPEASAGDLTTGLPAAIRYAAKDYRGTVASISPEVEHNAVRGQVRFADRLPGLRQNQRVDVRIVLDQRDEVLKVERGPFIDTDSVAYRVEGEVATRQPVTFGTMNAREIVILSGLNTGDRVIVSSLAEFKHAPLVRLTD